MGYNKENFKRIREEFRIKGLMAEQEADERRAELYGAIPELWELDSRLSSFGLRIMQSAISGFNAREGIADLRRENEKILEERALLLRKNGYPANYSDVKYECDKCRDTGYVGIQMCSCMRRALVEAGMASSGLSGLIGRQSFENFDLSLCRQDAKTAAKMEENYHNLQNYANNFSMGRGENRPNSLLFIGGTGLGKTHLSTAVARVVVERGYDVYYNSAVGMISDFEQKRFGNGVASDGQEGDNTARYTGCDLLIIDDLGTEVINQFTLSCIYHVLNTRLNLQLPTIISTNLSTAELQKNYNDRLVSRLYGDYVVVPFYGKDVRLSKKR